MYKRQLKADPNVVLYALGEIFPERFNTCLEGLRKVHGDKVQVDEGRKFVGFDAYQKVIDSGVDVVLLATPPHFRLVSYTHLDVYKRQNKSRM